MSMTAHTPGRSRAAPVRPPRRRPRRLLVIAALAGGLLGLTACAPALAQGGPPPGRGPGGPPPNDLEFRLVQQMLRGAADTLGLTEQDLLAPDRAGRGLADVAASRGVAPDELLAAMTAAGRGWVAAEVDAGRLRADEATALLARSDQLAVAILTFAPPPPPGAPAGGFPPDAPPPPPGALPPPGMSAPPR